MSAMSSSLEADMPSIRIQPSVPEVDIPSSSSALVPPTNPQSPSLSSRDHGVQPSIPEVDIPPSSSALVPPTNPQPPSLGNPDHSVLGGEGCSFELQDEEASEVDVGGYDDIGLLLRSMPQSRICHLSPGKKYSLLINHFKPGSNYKFPSRPLDGCNRACQHKYLVDNPHFVYSKAEDGIFCLPCVLFADSKHLGQFVREKFNHWTRKNVKFSSHNSKNYHQVAMTRVECLKSSMSIPGSSLEDCIRKVSREEIARNRLIVRSLAEAVLFCGRQCIALRGHRDDSSSDEDGNKGNFLSLIDYAIKSGNKTLGKHLKEAARNALYTSKTIQNQLIECIGEHIRNRILDDVKLARWFTILCDEVVDVARKEQVSIVLRFVDDH